MCIFCFVVDAEESRMDRIVQSSTSGSDVMLAILVPFLFFY